MRVPLLLLLILLLTSATHLHAQTPDSTQVVAITLEDGSNMIGRFLSESETSYVFRTNSGIMMEIPKAKLSTWEALSGRFRRLDPNRVRLFVNPTARPLPAGQFYFSDLYLFIPSLGYGIGNVVTLAGGITIFPGLGGQIAFLTPKVTLYNEPGLSIATGALIATPIGFSEADDFVDTDFFFGALFGVATIGSPEGAVTMGVSYGYLDDQFADVPLFLAGFDLQLSSSIKLISENFLVHTSGETFVGLSAGLRFFGRQLAADLALITSSEVLTNGGGFPFAPFVGFAYNFGGPLK